jgi:hypothetical protein
LENPESTANTMKKSVSLFLDQMSSALNPLPEDEDEAIMIVGSDTVTLSRLQVISIICEYFNFMSSIISYFGNF